MFIKSTTADGLVTYINFEKINHFETYGFLGIRFFFGDEDIEELQFTSQKERNTALDKILKWRGLGLSFCDLSEKD